MFFKIHFLILSCYLFLLVGCDLKINDQPPKQDDLVFEDATPVKCMSETVSYFEAFLRAEPDGAKVKEFWICSALAIKSFKSKTKGFDDSHYSAKAVAVFIEKYFFDDVVIGEPLIEQAMKLKQILIGGSVTTFSNDELDQLILAFIKLGDLTEELYPYMPLFSGKWQPKADKWDQADVEYFEKANTSLDKVVSQLLDWIKSDSPDYPIDGFLVFLKEFDKLMKHTVDFASPIEKLWPVLKKLKTILSAGRADYVAVNEWKSFLRLGSKGYMIYLRWNFFLHHKKVNFAEEIWSVSRIFDDGLILITELLSSRNNARISGEDLYEILNQFHELYPEFMISKKIVNQFMLLKKSMLGSSSEYWELKDFGRARFKVQVLRDLALKLLPYLDFFRNPSTSIEFFEEAIAVLQSSKERFILLWDEPYDYANISTILDELLILYPKKSEYRDQWQIYFPVFLSAKMILIGNDSTLIGPNDWRNLLDPALSLFGILARQKYFPKKDLLFSAAGLEFWAHFVQSISHVFESSVRLRPDAKISVIEFEKLLRILVQSKLIGEGLDSRLSLLKNLMQIKKALIGSSIEFWTAKDFAILREKLDHIRDLVISLLPYRDLDFNEKDRNYINTAFSTIKKSCPGFIKIWDGSLDLKLIKPILADLESLFGEVKQFEIIWDKYLPIFLSAKQVMTGVSDSLIDSKKLDLFLGPMINLFEIYTNQKYFPNRDSSFLTKSSIIYWAHLVNSIFIEFESVLKTGANSQVRVSDIEFFLKVINEGGLSDISLNKSHNLISHLMEVKKSILGTSSDFWSLQDVIQVRPKISFAQNLTVDLIPYLDIIIGNWQPDIENLGRSKKHLQSLIQIFDSYSHEFIALWKKPFDWTLIPVLLDDFSQLSPRVIEFLEIANSWNTYFPVLVAAKQVIVGDSSTRLDSKDWNIVFEPAFAFYSLYLDYRYFTSKTHFLSKDGFEVWNSSISTFLNLLYPISKTRGQIPLFEIQDFISTLKISGLVNLNFDISLINKMGPLLLTHYLIDPKYQPQTGFYAGLNSHHIDYLSIKWQNWLEAERFIFALLDDINKQPIKLSGLHLKVDDLVSQLKQQKKYTLSLMQMSTALKASQNLFLIDKLILPIFDPLKNFVSVNETNLTLMNLVRSVVDLAFAGYLPKGRGFLLGIEQPEFKNFVNDLIPVLKNIGYLKTAKSTFAESRFLEANLLTPSADGNEVLSFQEGVELATMITSGISRNDNLLSELEKLCRISSDEFAEIDCFRRTHYENRMVIYRNMPGWLSFMQDLNPAQTADFSTYLELGSEVEIVNQKIYVRELMLLTNLSQYIETIFTRFNSNGDNILETKEAMQAFPLFKNLLTKISKLSDPEEVRSLFAYILKYGRAPEQNLAGLIEFKYWHNNPSSWNLRVDRLQLSKIFNFIQTEKNKKKSE